MSHDDKTLVLTRLLRQSWQWWGCFEWEGADNGQDYGQVTWRGKRWYVHRLAYSTWNGPIPTGLVVDHLCRNPRCWRPTHLEAVTQAENVRRAAKATATHCQRGHEFTSTNTLRTVSGHRACRACRALAERRRRARTRQNRTQEVYA